MGRFDKGRPAGVGNRVQITDHLRERNCPVCGSADDSRVSYPSRFDERNLDSFAFSSRKLPEFMHLRLLHCPVCGVLYASPALTADFLVQAYREAAYDSNEEANLAARTYARILHPVLQSLRGREAALEVGAGNGAFLHHLRAAGFRRVTGIEPSGQAVSAAEKSIRPLIRLGMFRSGDFEPASLSLFCCFQTLEHIEHPRALCLDAFGLLRPGGAIFLVTHNYESKVNRILGERSPIFDIEHLQLFSRGSLAYLLESCGFQWVQTGAVWNCYPLSYWIKLLPISTDLRRRLVPLSRRLQIGKLPLRANVGNIYAVAFKPAS